jgi:hypothetical protein
MRFHSDRAGPGSGTKASVTFAQHTETLFAASIGQRRGIGADSFFALATPAVKTARFALR